MIQLAKEFVFAMISFPVWGIVIKSTIAVALAALACSLLHQRSAALRHRVWVFGLAASLAVPVTSWLVPQFTVLLPPGMRMSGAATTREHARPVPTHTAGFTLPASPGEISSDVGMLQLELERLSNPGSSEQKAFQGPEAYLTTLPGHPGVEQILALIWLVGTVTSSTVFLISLSKQLMRLSRLRSIDDDDWVESVATAARTLALNRPVVTLESDRACVPAVIGVLRPRLVVPGDWRTWSLRQRQCILLHELAHIKRCDVLTQFLGRLTLLAYWFNPLVWYAVRQLRAERELASDDCVLLAGQRASDYAEQLLRTLQSYRCVRVAVGVAMAHSARLDQRVLAILDPKRRREPVGSRFAILLPCIVGIACGVLGGLQVAVANPSMSFDTSLPAENVLPVWKENHTIEYPGTLPVSVAFSADGKTLATGDTDGEIMALVFRNDEPLWRWKSKVGGAHAQVAFSADQKKIYATTEHGVYILDATRGKRDSNIEENDSNPTAIGVFPDKAIAENMTRSQIVFGNPRGYFVKSWVQGKLPDSIGTIETSTVRNGQDPPDEAAVPLAVDPSGRSAIMTGPIDASGKITGVKGKNVLWAYVCGDHQEGSPGNRVMVGHSAVVVSAAWAKEGHTAVTGDAAGRVIVWDAKQMKETGRLEFGGRIAAVAISDDGARTAAYVLGRHGAVFVWETSNPVAGMKPIHTELADFSGPGTHASLSFAPDGKKLAGCASHKKWLTRLGELVGKVRVWELSPEPKAQLPPSHLYSKSLPKDSTANFVVLNNHRIVMAANKQGAIDFRSIADGGIQARITLGKFAIGNMKLSNDRRWLAMEQHAEIPPGVTLPPSGEFDVAVWDMNAMQPQATISSCTQLVEVAPGGEVIAVVRENQVELWEVASSKLLKSAPFKHTRIDAASFSPDGKLLAVSDCNDLVLWRWEKNSHERIDLGRCVGSLAFSPDGRFLAEGPTPRENIQIRDVQTRQVVQTLANGTTRSMNVPRLTYSQSGRVLIACDNITFAQGITVPHRINLWDMADGSLAHELAIPEGLPKAIDVSPNGRFLAALLEDSNGVSLRVWRLDGKHPVNQAGPKPPADTRP